MRSYLEWDGDCFELDQYGSTQGPKNRFLNRFFGEKSVFGWVGNDFGKDKSFVKKSKNFRYFTEKNRFFPKFLIFSLAPKI